MQGITLQANSDDQTIITIESANLDPVASPLVEVSLELIRHTDAETAQERVDWRTLAHASLNRVYGTNEPDYNDVPTYRL